MNDNFIPGVKHPDTPKWIYVNVWQRDRMRKILSARCKACDTVISTRDEQSVREIAFKCKDPNCCKPHIQWQAHWVCETCYDMFHALYFNRNMRNMNYFKNLDEQDARNDGSDKERRRRMGLE